MKPRALWLRKPRPSAGQPFKLLRARALTPPSHPMADTLFSFPQTGLPACQPGKARGQVLGPLKQGVTSVQPEVLQVLAIRNTCQQDRQSRKPGPQQQGTFTGSRHPVEVVGLRPGDHTPLS